MARGYDSQVINYCELAGWEADKKAASECSTSLHDMSNGKTRETILPCEVYSGAVQRGCASEAIAVEDKGVEDVVEKVITTVILKPENLSPKINIAPIPSRLRMYVPPTNFGAVEEDLIYRSGFPQSKNYSFLESLKLKTILTLVPEPLSEEYTEFIHKNRIRHVQIHIPANKDGVIKITPERMVMALSVVLDRTTHPLLIHCNRGKHRTGCVTACLRKVQALDTDAAVAEYRDYSYPKCRDDDMAFIKSFEPEALLWYAQAKGWPVTPPPEPSDEAWAAKKDSFVFTLEDIAARKLPEEPDQSL